MIDNIEVAILGKVNQLAEHYGLKAYDFVAAVVDSNGSDATALHFEIPAQGNALRQERFDSMCRSLGVNEDGSMTGAAHIIDSLDTALERAPRKRPRF